MECPALELAGCWMETCLSFEIEVSGRALADWLLYGARRSLVVQCPELGSPTSETQAWHPAGAPDPVSHTAGVPLELEKLACSGSPSALHIRITCFFLVLPQRQCSTEKNSPLENSHSSEMAFFFPLCLVRFHLLTGGHVQRPRTRLFLLQFLVWNLDPFKLL